MSMLTIIEFFALMFAFMVLFIALIGFVAFCYYWIKEGITKKDKHAARHAFDYVMELQDKHIGF